MNKIKYRQHTLVVSTRDIDQRQRFLMHDIKAIIPHQRSEQKIQKEQIYKKIPMICEDKKCKQFISFEGTPQKQLYLWTGRFPNGPSIKFKVDNIHTIEEMHLAGNFANSGKTILSFDKKFDDNLTFKLCKEVLSEVFRVPKTRNRYKPFVDRVIQFTSQTDSDQIWFRNYEIIKENNEYDLSEIGPRFVLSPIQIFDGCMMGKELYRNEFEISIQNKTTIYSIPKQKLKKKSKNIKKFLEQIQNQEIESDEIMDDEYINALKSKDDGIDKYNSQDELESLEDA